ncbi:MAG: hypothetical protein IJ450_00230 [Bacteroidales bacterium]|nr:hypothetical protein [Bacteroidales bacterium]
MNDDLLIRFIDGKTTPEETEFVLNELSRDGDAAKEWMQMVQGSRLADTDPIVHIEPGDFIARTLEKGSSVQSRGRKVVRLPWIISGITAVAASIAVIVTVMVNYDKNDLQQDFVAEVPDTTVVIPEADSIAKEGTVDIKNISHQAIAEVTEPINEEPKLVEPKAEEQVEEQTQPQEQSMELIGNKMIQDTYTASVSESKTSSFEIIKPAKSPYRVRVQNPEKEFVFEWKMSDVANIRLSIADKNGRIIIDNEWIVENRYGIVASDLVDRGELDWTVEVTFNDGSMQRKSGKIELISVKE